MDDSGQWTRKCRYCRRRWNFITHLVAKCCHLCVINDRIFGSIFSMIKNFYTLGNDFTVKIVDEIFWPRYVHKSRNDYLRRTKRRQQQFDEQRRRTVQSTVLVEHGGSFEFSHRFDRTEPKPKSIHRMRGTCQGPFGRRQYHCPSRSLKQLGHDDDMIKVTFLFQYSFFERLKHADMAEKFFRVFYDKMQQAQNKLKSTMLSTDRYRRSKSPAHSRKGIEFCGRLSTYLCHFIERTLPFFYPLFLFCESFLYRFCLLLHPILSQILDWACRMNETPKHFVRWTILVSSFKVGR